MGISVDGCSVGVFIDGAAGAPIVLLHGAGMDHRAYQAIVPILTAAGRRVVRVDLRGHGASEGAAFEKVADAANWLERVLGVLDLDSSLLAGHSYGALVALELAACHSGRVSSLALLGVADAMPVNAGLLATAANDPDTAAGLVAGWCHGVSRKSDPDGAAEWTQRILSVMDGPNRGVLAADLQACDAYGDAPSRAVAVACPVTVILGTRDKMTPVAGGLALAHGFAHARVSELDCGHMMMMERPEETARLLLEAS